MAENNALHTAAIEGNIEEIQSQVSNFDINSKGENDGTPLLWAARKGNTEAVILLLTFNPDVNIYDVRKLKMICVYPYLLVMYPSPTTHPILRVVVPCRWLV